MHHSEFVHLHLHTQYSLLDGAIRPGDLVAQAKDYRMPAVAVTDHGNLFGAVEFYQKAMAGGIKPIIGCETYVAPGSRTDKAPPSRGGHRETAFHLVLLVKNATGYKNLCRLLSLAYTEGFYYRPRIDKELLKEMNEGLIALGACLQGEVSHLALRGQMDAALTAAEQYKEIFSNRRFFLEVQHNGMEEQEKINGALVEIGKKLDIPLVATNDCHYLKKEDSKIHDVLLCIQTGTTVNATERMRFPTDEFYFKSPEEMINSFRDMPEAVTNTIEIAERCNFEMSLGTPHLPDFPVPKDETLDSLIEKEAAAGLEGRLKVLGEKGTDVETIKWQYFDRLARELKVIKGMGFSGYFLIVSDFINFAKKEDIPVGPGRGSAAGSLVAYSLGITNLDPIRYNLLFERFLNPDRISLPDIDIDFCYEKRDRVIKYVTEKYGSDNVTQIITFGQMRARAVIRDVGRVLDLPYADVDRIAKLIPTQLNITIEEALRQEPKLVKLASDDGRVAELIKYAKALEGLPRHASTHAAGVVISNKPLVEYLPLYMGQKENIITTQYSMKDVEKIGLVKFDFLGLKTLTVIDRTLRFIKAKGSDGLDLDALDLDDAATYESIAAANTNGIFQLESSGMKELLKRLKPSSFEDLVAAVALFRPGPLQSGMVDDFIKRKNKLVSVKYDLPQLKDILDNTYGVIVYQEQVMEIAKVLAGFTPGDADILRKAMGKKLPEEMVVQRTKFLEGAKRFKINPKKAEKIFDLMAKFAGYGFNKSHSAAYALISYQTAYLKTHYTVEFMAALLSSDMGNTDQVVKYVGECRALGITVSPPDINESTKEFSVSGVSIRFGLEAIKNVGSSAIDEILSVRDEAPFESIVDFLSRVDTRKVNKKVVESLIKCGAFDFTGADRGNLMRSLEGLMETAHGVQRDRDLGQKTIFDVLGPSGSTVPVSASPPAPAGAGWTEKELLGFEKETLGFYFSSHPLSGHEAELQLYTTRPIGELKEVSDRETVTAGGVVAGCKEINTKKGKRMGFMRLEDTTGGVEVVLFPDVYAASRELLNADKVLLVKGRLDRDENEVKIIASELMPLEDAKNREKDLDVKNTHIYVKTEGLEANRLDQLKDILKTHPGGSAVFIHLLYPDGREVVIRLSDEFTINPVKEALSSVCGVMAGARVKVA